MKVIIPKNELSQHNVDKYRFRPLQSFDDDDSMGSREFTPTSFDTPSSKTPMDTMQDNLSSAASVQSGDSPQAAPSIQPLSASNNELVENLLKKTDEMSTNLIKLQMKYEATLDEHKKELESVKHQAYNDGFEEGKKQCLDEIKSSKDSEVDRLASSVKTLEESSVTFTHELESIKKDLIHAALDIAKEVIKVEVSENSGAIADKLSEELIKQLQQASKVTLKVNPADHGFIAEKVGKLENVNIVSDSAVSPGGVIAMSDAGNIDSDLMKRYERVKQAALSE